jgi:lysozyme family protein
MAMTNLARCLGETLPHEGGWADHPKDPGGATMKGVTLAVYRRFKPGATKAQLRNITDAELLEIYRAGYWEPVRGDELPAGVDLSMFDYGVNSGPGRAIKDAQRVVGVPVDNRMGPVTLAAIKAMPPRKFIKAHCAKRLGFVQSLKIWDTFGKGWSRRIASIEAVGLSWVSSKAQLEADSKEAANKSATNAGGAVVTTGGGVAVDQTPDITGLPWWAVALIVAAVVVPMVLAAIIQAQRAAALKKVAKEA